MESSAGRDVIQFDPKTGKLVVKKAEKVIGGDFDEFFMQFGEKTGKLVVEKQKAVLKFDEKTGKLFVSETEKLRWIP